jgi:hypothetical protein
LDEFDQVESYKGYVVRRQIRPEGLLWCVWAPGTDPAAVRPAWAEDTREAARAWIDGQLMFAQGEQ